MSGVESAVDALERIRSSYGPEAWIERRRSIEAVEATRIDDPDLLLRYHDVLLFLRAYPDNADALGLADRALGRVAKRLQQLDDAEALRDTGLPCTSNVHTYSWSMLREMLPSYPGRFEVEWPELEDSAPFFEIVALCTAASEVPGIDDDRVDVDEWLLSARSPRESTDLEMLYHLLEGSGLPEQTRELLFDRLRLPIRWTLSGPDDSRTLSIRKRKTPFFHPEPLLREALDLSVEMRRPLPVERLDLAESRAAIRWMKSAMSVRNRELYPLCHPEERDVVRVQADRGLEIYCFGVRPTRRLLIEGLYGQFLVKNGVPIGYALSSVVGRVCEIGLNIYDTFRAGESAFIYSQLLRTFTQLFGAEWFWVPRLQAGYGNDEGIESGAYWFYDKLGFRSLDPKIRAIADRERARRSADRSYRAPVSVLKRLVNEDLAWSPAEVHEPGLYPLGAIGLSITRWISTRWNGDRDRALVWAEREARKRLGIRSVSRGKPAEQEAFRRLAPLVALIPDWREWSSEERNLLARMVRAKGANRESEYIDIARRHARWLAYLRQAQSA